MVILLVCVTYDKEIVHFSEHSGFISYTSRKLKFYILFTVVIAIVFASMIISGMGDAWSNDLKWIQNIINVSISPLLSFLISLITESQH